MKSLNELFTNKLIKEVRNYMIWRFRLSHENANDLIQDSCLKACIKYHTFDETKASFKTWFVRIAMNTLIDNRNAVTRERAVIVSNVPQYEDSCLLSELIASDGKNPEEIFNSKQRKEMVLKAINKLPVMQQDVLYSLYIMQLSHKEISQFLEIPIGSLKAYSVKAKENLGKLLSKELK